MSTVFQICQQFHLSLTHPEFFGIHRPSRCACEGYDPQYSSLYILFNFASWLIIWKCSYTWRLIDQELTTSTLYRANRLSRKLPEQSRVILRSVFRKPGFRCMLSPLSMSPLFCWDLRSKTEFWSQRCLENEAGSNPIIDIFLLTSLQPHMSCHIHVVRKTQHFLLELTYWEFVCWLGILVDNMYFS